MFSWIRKRFTYTNVAMTLALVFAMTGGAYAARKYIITSTKEIKPSVLAQLKGKDGAIGKDGVNGTNGKDGVNGTNGKDGVAGENGRQGEKGVKGDTGSQGLPGAPGKDGTNGVNGKSVISAEFTGGKGTCTAGGSEFEVEGSGKATYACNGINGTGGGTGTEKGDWAMTATATAAGQASTSPISFGTPLAKAPATVVYVMQGESTPAGCTGSVLEPGAEKGHLCVFVRQEANAEPYLGSHHFINPEGEGFAVVDTAGTGGTTVIAQSLAAGSVIIFGDWAVTE